jgi:hypothetical protein
VSFDAIGRVRMAPPLHLAVAYVESVFLIRYSGATDQAALDSRRLPEGSFPLAETDGELVAAAPLDVEAEPMSDPFRPGQRPRAPQTAGPPYSPASRRTGSPCRGSAVAPARHGVSTKVDTLGPDGRGRSREARPVEPRQRKGALSDCANRVRHRGLSRGSGAADPGNARGTSKRDSATVHVSRSKLGRMLGDGRRHTLYLFEKDRRGTSRCRAPAQPTGCR